MHRTYSASIFATREPMRRDSPKVRSGLSGIYGAAVLSQIDAIDLVLPAFDGSRLDPRSILASLNIWLGNGNVEASAS